MSNFILQERHGQIAVLTFNRPEALNAVDEAVLRDLETHWRQLEDDPNVRIVIFSGGDSKAFVAGGDIRAMAAMSPAEGRRFVEYGHAVLNRIEKSRLISIAAVNGYALGGGTELALACDLRIASERATFGLPEVSIGLFPGWGGTQRITRLLGVGKGKELVYTADRISAEEALRLGLVNDVVPHEQLMSHCFQLAERILKNSPRALEQAKLAIVYGLEQPLEYGLRIEIESWLVNFATEDRVEGLTAFLEKRQPQWKNR